MQIHNIFLKHWTILSYSMEFSQHLTEGFGEPGLPKHCPKTLERYNRIGFWASRAKKYSGRVENIRVELKNI